MSIRYGYVSNSSSSSFIVYGKKLGLSEALELCKVEGNKVACILPGCGHSGDCADFVFTLSEGRLALLKKCGIDISKYEWNAEFYLSKKEWYNELSSIHEVDEPLDGGCLFVVHKDYSSPVTDADDDEGFLEWLGIKGGRK